MKPNLKVGLVGAGVFAGYHAQKVMAHRRADLIGLYDHNLAKAKALSNHLPVERYEDLEQLCQDADAMIIATPATRHYQAALAALDAGCHMLIEKPITADVGQAQSLIESAKNHGRIIQVGHQERIVIEAIGLRHISERPIAISAKRMTGRTERNMDVSVILDLMIHDIDLVQWLLGRPPEIASASGRVVYSDHIDEAKTTLQFEGEAGSGQAAQDCHVALIASRNAQADRTLSLTYPNGTVSIDFLSKTLRNDTPFALNETFGERPDVQDNLATAFDHFVRACLDGSPPLVSGDDGLLALKTAVAIELGTLP